MANPNRIPVLEKAVDILEYIGSHPGPVTRTELQQALGIPQATCYRVIATLVEKQWLEAFSGNRYDLAWHLCRLTGKKRFDPEAYKKFQPLLNHLAGQLRFPVKLSIRDGEEFINVCSAQATWDVSLFSEPGTRCPVDCSSSVGTVFFAEAGGKGCDAESRKRIAVHWIPAPGSMWIRCRSRSTAATPCLPCSPCSVFPECSPVRTGRRSARRSAGPLTAP